MKTIFTVTTFVCLMLMIGIAWSATYWVATDGDDSNPGTISSPFATIQRGITEASNGDTVIAKNGTYTGDGNRNIDFQGKAITVRSIGGAANCIIDAENGGVGFLFTTGEGNDSVVQGFTITNCLGANGGAIACSGSSPTIVNCIITGNTASAAAGGIMCDNSSPLIVGCLIVGNTAGTFGGGIASANGASPMIYNCTITENSAPTPGPTGGGGGLACPTGGATVINSIIWGATSSGVPSDLVIGAGQTVNIDYSDYGSKFGTGTLIEGPGILPIDTNPLFVGGGDYSLTDLSPCIGAGTSDGLPSQAATDLTGKARPTPDGTNPDIGAYENDRDVPLAVTLSAFTATSNGDRIILNWRTESEINNLGFRVYRSIELDGDYVKITPTIIAGAGTEATPREYSFTDEDVVVDNTYYYYIENIDFSGKTSKSRIIEVKLGKQTVTRIIPIKSSLFQNFPNPFNPETWIPYQLAQNASVIVRIYNLKGRTVRTIELGEKDAGIYLTKDKAVYWDGRDDSGEKVASGVYFYTLQAGGFTATRRMVIVE